MSLGETKMQQALTWILARLADTPGAKRSELIEEAAREFDLTPLDEDFLYRKLIEATRPSSPEAQR